MSCRNLLLHCAHHVGPSCLTGARPSDLIPPGHCQLIGVERSDGLSNLATIVSNCVPGGASIPDRSSFTRLLSLQKLVEVFLAFIHLC